MSIASETHPAIKKGPILTVLLIGSFVSILNQTLLATALPPIMADLHIDLSTAQWLTTAFMLVNGIMIPITAFLIGTFTTRQLFIGAMSFFAIGTLIAALSTGFTPLLVGRILQAVGAGVMMPLTQVIILTLYPVEKRGAAMGIVGLVIGLGPAIGPTLAGVMVQHFPWRSLFYVVLPIVVINIILAVFIMKNVVERTHPKLDLFSIVLSTIGFGGLLFGFSEVGTQGWSSFMVIIPLILGIVGVTTFILRQFKLTQPILEFRVFRDPIYSLTTILSVITFISMLAAETLIPVYMQNMLGYSSLSSALALLPGAILMGVMMPITGRLFDKFGIRWLAIIGLFIITITEFFFTRLEVGTSFIYVLIVFMTRMIGISLVMMPLSTAGINRLSPKLISHGTAMNNTIRMVGGSIGTAILISIMSSKIAAAGQVTPEIMVGGVSAAFMVSTLIGMAGLILSFFLKSSPKESNEMVSESK